MEPIVLLFLSLLLSTQGSQTVTPVFVLTGHDLALDVQEEVSLEEGHDLTWIFNDKNSVVKLTYNKPIVLGSYKSRDVSSPQNFSLLVKNVTESDSGVYRARVSADTQRIVAEYQVTVQGPVSPVNLTVKNCSTDSSNLTVTCSTLDSLISSTFTCDHQTCSAERGDPSVVNTPAASFHVYLETGSVICNHSNIVSLEKDIIRIGEHCKETLGNQASKATIDIPAAVISILFVIIIAIIIAVFHSCRRKRKYEREKVENTEYHPVGPHTIQTECINQPLNQTPTNPASPVSAPSVYALVGPHTGPVGSQEPRGNPQPESLYATVEKTAKS